MITIGRNIIGFDLNINCIGYVTKKGDFTIKNLITDKEYHVKLDIYSNVISYDNYFSIYNESFCNVYDTEAVLVYDNLINFTPFVSINGTVIGSNKFGEISCRNLPNNLLWETKYNFSQFIISDELVFIYKSFPEFDSLKSIDIHTGKDKWSFQLDSKYNREFGKQSINAQFVGLFSKDDTYLALTNTGYLFYLDKSGVVLKVNDLYHSMKSIESMYQFSIMGMLSTCKFVEKYDSLYFLSGYYYIMYNINHDFITLINIQEQLNDYSINYLSNYNVLMDNKYFIATSNGISSHKNNIGIFDIDGREFFLAFDTNIDNLKDSFGNHTHPPIKKIDYYNSELLILDFRGNFMKTEIIVK